MRFEEDSGDFLSGADVAYRTLGSQPNPRQRRTGHPASANEAASPAEAPRLARPALHAAAASP